MPVSLDATLTHFARTQACTRACAYLARRLACACRRRVRGQVHPRRASSALKRRHFRPTPAERLFSRVPSQRWYLMPGAMKPRAPLSQARLVLSLGRSPRSVRARLPGGIAILNKETAACSPLINAEMDPFIGDAPCRGSR